MRPSGRITGSPASTSAMSLEVPPTSMVISSPRPADRPTIAPPITPAAGPDRNSRTGRWRATAVPVSPPRDCITCNGASTPAAGQAALEPFQVAIDHRLHVGIERGHHGALVFPERRIDLG